MNATRQAVEQFLTSVGAACRNSGRIYLTGETSQVFGGWRERTTQLEYAAEVAPEDRAALVQAVTGFTAGSGVQVLEEAPGDVIPLPAGYAERARPAGRYGRIEAHHFDPYSVAFRLIARGDEPDYHAVLAMLRQGWIELETMSALLAGLLPRFTSQTIQQDPAEFRRKYKGLLQMWRAGSP